MRFAAVMMIVTVLMSCSWAVYASSESSSSTASASSQVPTTGNSTDKEKAYRLLLGTEMMIGNYKNRPFSKLKKDILNQLEKEEGISFSFD